MLPQFMHFLLLLSAYQFLCMYVSYCSFMKLLESKPHCNELFALSFETVFEISQSLALVGQLARISHVWRIIMGHSTLLTNHLLFYSIHMVHENLLTPTFQSN